jgi:predicted GNAT family acetyltransferase
MEVVHLEDAGQALDRLGEPLREAGAEGELSYGILRRLVADPGAWGDEVTILVAVGSCGPLALVTMTGEHPALIVGFDAPSDVPFRALVEAMVAADRRPTGVNGARRWSEPFAQAWTDVAAAAAEVRRDMRAFELTAVRRPAVPLGAFRKAEPAEREQLVVWTSAMCAEIGEPTTDEESVRVVERLTAGNDLCVWAQDGQAVSMAAVTRRTPWSSCVALVYTPPELRGRGFASAVVADLSQRELDAGQLWCSLFTDLANPTSNHIYAEIGYQPRCDFRHFALSW